MSPAADMSAIEKLIKAKQMQSADDGSGDVVFALFLEAHPPDPHAKASSVLDSCINFVVNNLQPSPVMVHVELVVPCCPGSELPVNFATYIGDHAKWRTNKVSNESYYLLNNANRWRAVPIFSKNAAQTVRQLCNESEGCAYSLFRYFTAAWGVRYLASLVPDSLRCPAHCATLTARVLSKAEVSHLKHPSAYYGPAALYGALCDDLRRRPVASLDSRLTEDSLLAVDKILRDADSDLATFTDEQAMAAFRVLTLKAATAEAFSDTAAQTLTQKQLATALLRWSVHGRARRDSGES